MLPLLAAKVMTGLLYVTNIEKRIKTLNFLTREKRTSIYYDDINSKVRMKVSIKRIKVDATTVLDAN
jgi:hypothetical protein